MNLLKGVPHGRLFSFSSIILPGLFLTHSALGDLPSSCHGEAFDGRVKIAYVIDGDTIITAKGEHVRLIGIDTPEISHGASAPEPGAEAARNYLIQLLRHSDYSYPLRFGQEKYDHHGRTLAHLFLPDGSNVQALILSRGYATPLTIPPNVFYLDCYQQSFEQAFSGQQGLWSLPQYQPVNVEALTGNERGYHQVKGTVTGLSETRTSIWINLGREFAVRISRKNLGYFQGLPLDNLAGKTVLVRGKIYRHNRQLRIYLNHASEIRTLPDKAGTH